LSFVLIIGLGACQDDGLDILPEDDAAQVNALEPDSARRFAERFLNHWNDGNFEDMFDQITPLAKETHAQPEFVADYQTFTDTMSINSLSYDIRSVELQGTTAAIHYRVEFNSGLVDEFADPPDPDENRIMRLVMTEDGWRAAWSRMDILEDWTDSSRLSVELTPPERGNIYDRNGQILVDENGTSIGMYITKLNMRSSESQCVTELARILRVENSEIQEIFDNYLPETLFFIGEISQETFQREQGVLGSTCNPEYFDINIRQYYDRAAPHLIGYVGQIPAERLAEFRGRGYRDDALVGLSGIEGAFEEELAGTSEVQVLLRSRDTNQVIREVATREGQPGHDLFLSIDRELQLGLQSAMADAYNNAQPTWGDTSPGASAVVMNVNTGEILAMVSFPDFDPGLFNPNTPVPNPGVFLEDYNNDPRNPLFNRATQGRYPLGSVFKIFTMIAGLDSGHWPATRASNEACDGIWEGEQYGDQYREDWYLVYGYDYGQLAPSEALKVSCNIFFWEESMALYNIDPTILPNYAREMGFGTAPRFQGLRTDTGVIPGPDWKAQNVPENPEWSLSDALNLAIGQGYMGVNPLQVVQAVSAVANGGMLYQPLAVTRVQDQQGDPVITYEPEGEMVDVAATTFATVRDAMCQVTLDSEGTASFIFQDWYQDNNYSVIVCGKTGTAQTSPGFAPHAWFAAYAPQENPEIAVVVMAENSCEGSEVGAPITRRIMELYYDEQIQVDYGWPALWQEGCAELSTEGVVGTEDA
jgi:penicillin-binding protein 2